MAVSLRFKNFLALFLAAVLLLLPNTAAFAGKKDYPDPQIKIKPVSQEKSQWCWSAVSVMLLELYGKKMSQSEYAKFVNGSTDNVTIFKSQFIDKLNEKGIYGDYKATAATWNEIKSSIDKGRPVVVFKKKQKGNGHVLIINGYFNKPGDNTNYVIMVDPNGGTEDWYTYEEVANNSYNVWEASWINVRNKK
ncbi:C39 family peptidase [Brevibacillus sp. FSL K6-0770]|jgi:hypothetical protein|uniref:Peptidase C39-like domain-containing protein n=2 Tax=Brevibacillus parabrevis TaxID=54914 RepID=A0A4Y3PIS1_BREPA|nr:C39 family peptidase [Brevibacillus parabrevis]MBU8715244.1 C39 family peptidase [Brevibacillus parabrevis]MED2254996.1 C39 family peptidase [Brevibacillus parabrevis]RNB93763.1 hypothetical protein EDM60_19740 [Brevibacillus parabrevis]GEB33187.1 hypothetical protein BPA01_27670 [Brevibacillus parabrevis]